MLGRLAHALPLAVMLAAAGCNCGDKKEDGDSAEEQDPFVGDSEVEASIRALGGDGTVVVVVRPDQWPALQAALLPIVEELDAGVGSDLSGVDTPEKGMALLGTLFDLSSKSMQLEGWDPARPIVGSFFESPYQGAPGTILPQIPIGRGHVADMRHAVLLPAKEDKALVESLAGLVARLHYEPEPELVEAVEGARAFRRHGYSVAFLPEGKHVRIVVLGDGMPSPEDRKNNAARLAPPKSEVVWTPATSLLTAEDTAAALLFRPWRGRAAASWGGSVEALRAIQTVSRDQRASARMKGSQIVLIGELLFEDLGADFDDHALQLVVNDGTPRLRAAMSLAPDGREVVDAIEDELRPPFELKTKDVWAEFYVGGDIRGALNAATPPAWLSDLPPDEVFDRVRYGGQFALLNVALRHPFGVGRYAFDAAAPRAPVSLEKLPLAVHAVLLGFDGRLPKGALAVELPEGASAIPITGMLALAKTSPDLAGLEVMTKNRDGHPVVLIGLGVDPSTVFELDDADSRGIAYVRVDPAAIARGMPEALPSAMAKLPSWQMQWQRRGRAIVGELVPDIGKGRDKLGKVPVARLRRWDSPVGSEESDGLECLTRAGRGVAEVMGASVMVADDQIATAFMRGMEQVKKDLACAEEEGDTKEAAQGLRLMLVEGASEMLVVRRRNADALRILDAYCGEGLEQACETASRIKELPQPSPLTGSVPSYCPDPWSVASADFTVVLDASRMTLDDAPVEMGTLRDALKKKIDDGAARLEELGLDEFDRGGPESVLGLHADANTKMARIRPILQTARELGVDAVRVSIAGGSEDRPVRLPLTDKPKGTEWLVWTVDRNEVTTRGAGLSSSVSRTSPTAERLSVDIRIYADLHIDITDDTTWQQASVTFAAGCTEATLLTNRFSR